MRTLVYDRTVCACREQVFLHWNVLDAEDLITLFSLYVFLYKLIYNSCIVVLIIQPFFVCLFVC